MENRRHESLPYDMGNAGDLLKHGVGQMFRFFDLFGGKPWEEDAHPEVMRRVQALTDTALLDAQPEIAQGRYYGSAHLVWQAAENAGAKNFVQICASDSDARRARQLRDSGLRPMQEVVFPLVSPDGKTPPYDGYDFFDAIVDSHQPGDLTLIDPFGNFLPRKSGRVVPRMAEMSKRAAAVLFALNLNPNNLVGQRFDGLLKAHLSGALRMTCPPIRKSGVKGEGTYYADVVLAAPDVSAADGLRAQLSAFAEKLADVLGLSGENAEMLKPKVIGREG